ncbi:hypothetical protein Poli38472_008903 [Pythium oligandrum]|uniref:Protein ENHANCED DISEASE RESISTANCE 2 C-terminal domain-containing protein n=1 Tax=Pythium oligandrum TaxID=41045 RepID=A0A8K1C4I8_PYTOL|nr:hypothetical protein Poli38472_008903 [Pythium oligandrum]|eukprot:TMW56255.1 hypothetical protein Poli38472_008903 [Pythium oligandrum]
MAMTEHEPSIESTDATSTTTSATVVDEATAALAQLQCVEASEDVARKTTTPAAAHQLTEDLPFSVYSPSIRTMWSEPDADQVLVRGSTYLDDQVKVAAGPSLGKLLHVDVWSAETPEARHHIARFDHKRDQSVLRYCEEKHPESLVFILNIELPDADNVSLVSYWLLPNFFSAANTSDSNFSRLLRTFYEADNSWCDNRFKLIPSFVNAPWLLSQLVPSRPALTGLRLTQHYHRADNYFELDLDVSSSTTARYIGSLCQSWSMYVEMDVFLTVQGETEDELPEQVFAGLRFSYLDLSLATTIRE